jgi:serine/threonine protein phosphatase PrpC
VSAPHRQDQLRIAAGFASSAGRRPDNQDFGGVDLGSPQERALQGVLAAVADGAGGGEGGRTASELAVRGFIDAYRSQSELVGVGAAAAAALEGYNRWLHAQAQIAPSLRGAAATFTAAVLRGRLATIVHVGDSRAWHFRLGHLALLTDDHAALTADGGQRLLRALGLEPNLRLDVKTQAIEAHDRLLLTTDGVHGALSWPALTELLGRRQDPQADAEAIVSAAVAAGHDNATAVVIDILQTPAPDYSAITAAMAPLPMLAAPSVGETIDGFRLVRLIAENPTTRLFLAKDGAELVALKFPRAEAFSSGDRERFVRELFIGQRIAHPNIGAALQLAEGRQSRLYLAMPFHAGETLEDRLRRGPLPIGDVIAIGAKVGRGLSALHRAGIAHRDIKPQNILLLDDGEVKIIDLGVARLAQADDLDALEEAETPGTVDFMAPELFEQGRGDALSDQYALGVTLYRMLTDRYPLGETPPGNRPLFGPAPPAARYRRDAPAWLDATVAKAIALKPQERFGDVAELVFELEHGKRRAAPLARARPLIERSPTLFWKLLCGLLALLLALSLLTHR